MKLHDDSSMEETDREASLIQALKHGDTAAFESIYHMYFHRLYIYCLQFCKSANDAEDIVQEVFAKLWTSRNQIKHERSLRSLLFKMVRNHLVSAFRKTVSSPVFEDYMDYVNSMGREDNHTIDFIQFEHRIKDVMSHLPASQRKILYMSRFEDCTNKEIAKELGINEQSVKNSISRSLKFMRHMLKDLALTLLLFLEI